MYLASAILGNIDSKTFVSAQLLGTDGVSLRLTLFKFVQDTSNRVRAK
jgi:hypothetical protein